MSSGFDFNKLCSTFSEICPDFGESHQTDKSESLNFAKKVLFELGPKMWHIKQSGSGQMWRLIFNEDTSVYIYTHSFQRPVNVNPQLRDKKLYLTLKQAGLLAVSKLCSGMLGEHDPRNKVLLTPLARAVFLPENIPEIAVELTELLKRRVDTNEVVRAVISSCQTDGFHLQHSQCHIALAALEATVPEAAQRQKLREKTRRLYAKHGKTYDATQYDVYVKYSKRDDRAADARPSQRTAGDQGRPKGESIDAVLRSIVKSADDPLSGGTLDMKYVQPSSSSQESEMGPF
ncbi:hypothetical protein AWZ03_002319 [Drosophila navojoa]|uniref:Uncharacterized protein n=1 Tax=Drosophila navojoa TaxID=7232 RepID=A0A484BSN4_DRONA|nr:uncharacterized protein LOC115565770 [Drosophila navojoa]XP_030247066.1 uncharacterized protein LOC115565770 [Drosophila navojoa]TDG51232.1 hypothetical protein AWZ03_002319 [Drosophila navojoa]